MSVIAQIEKTLLESKRIAKITDVVLPTLETFYGKPKWLTVPKEGQVPDDIIKSWANSLGMFSNFQLENACCKVHRFKKSQTFPEIAHIREQLCDEKPEDEDFYYKVKDKDRQGGFDIESWLMQLDGGEDLKNLKFIRPDYCALVRFVCDERLPEKIGYGEWEKLNGKERVGESGIKFKTAWENGLFDDRADVLPLIKLRRFGKDVFIPLLPDE